MHGHSYTAEVTIAGPIQTEGVSAGMVVDFSDLDVWIKDACGPWDHALMLEDSDPFAEAVRHYIATSGEHLRLVEVPWAPTAENIAIEVAQRINQMLVGSGVSVANVRVFETPKSWTDWVAS